MSKARSKAMETDPPLGDDDRKYRAPALEKGLDILEMLARCGGPMTVSQISAGLDRSVGELFRMIQVLEFRGFIEPSPFDDGYVLTNKMFQLAMAQAPMRTLTEAAIPEMRRLADEIGQSCHLVVASDDQIVVVARAESPGMLGFSVRVGYRRPILHATSGALLYAFQPEATQQAWLRRLSEGATKREISDFLARAEAHRTQGYARRDSEFVEGVTDVAAPIEGPTHAVATLVVPFVRQSPPVCSIEAAIDRVRLAAARVSKQLITDE